MYTANSGGFFTRNYMYEKTCPCNAFEIVKKKVHIALWWIYKKWHLWEKCPSNIFEIKKKFTQRLLVDLREITCMRKCAPVTYFKSSKNFYTAHSGGFTSNDIWENVPQCSIWQQKTLHSAIWWNYEKLHVQDNVSQ